MESIDDRGMHDEETEKNEYTLVPENLMSDKDTKPTLVNGDHKHF